MNSRLAIIAPDLAPLGELFWLDQFSDPLPLNGLELHVVSLFNHYQRGRLPNHSQIEVHQLQLRGAAPPIRQRLTKSLHDIQPETLIWWGTQPVDLNSRVGSRHREITGKWLPWWPHANRAGQETSNSTRAIYRQSRSQLNGELVPPLLSAPRQGNQQDRQPVRLAIAEFLDIPVNEHWIVTVADLQPRNQLKDLIWGLDLLRCIRDDVHLLIIGQGPQLQPLQRFAESTAAADFVHWLGMPEEADRIVAACDVYWHSHLNQEEPAGMLVAMANEVPVVSAWGRATASLVRPQQTAWAVPLGSRDQYARWTKYILENPEATRMMVTQARQHLNLANRTEQLQYQLERLLRS